MCDLKIRDACKVAAVCPIRMHVQMLRGTYTVWFDIDTSSMVM
jgi:hypothetical protein